MKTKVIKLIIRCMKILAESILPLLFWVFLIFGFDVPYVAILTIIAAVIHEIGHIVAISATCNTAIAPTGHVSGFRIKKHGYRSYREDFIILAAGPVFNIAVFILTLPFESSFMGYIRIFGIINLATAISNLLPVEGYDGYGILTQLFTSRNMPCAIKALELISFIFSVSATFFSLYVINKFDSGYWIFGIFFVLTVSKLVKSEKYDILRE